MLLSEVFGIMDDYDICVIIVIDNDGKLLGFVKCWEVWNVSGICVDIIYFFCIMGKVEDNLCIVLFRLYESNISWMLIVDEDGCYNGEIF